MPIPLYPISYRDMLVSLHWPQEFVNEASTIREDVANFIQWWRQVALSLITRRQFAMNYTKTYNINR